MARKCLFIGLVSLMILSSTTGCRFLIPGQQPTQPGTTPSLPVVEVDVFPDTVAKVTVKTPTGQSFIVELTGPTTVHVFFEGATEGEAGDDDGDGLDEVSTEIVAMDLIGISNMGQVKVRLNPDIRSTGEIEEITNNTPGVLDLPPFTNVGTANSFFDVYFELEVGGVVLRTTEPKRMETVIRHKPPKEGDTYENPEWIPLVDLNGRHTGFFVGPAFHIPTPLPKIVEVDVFPDTLAKVTVIAPTRQEVEAEMTGPTTVHVYFEGATEGEARDDDGDGLDEVDTEIVAMSLKGISSMVPVEVRLNPDIRSTGEIEEITNNTPGILDVPPFAPVGSANSFFDVYFEIEIGGVVLRTTEPKRMETVIRHKPPKEGDTYENPEWIPLVDLNGRHTGFFVGPAFHIPTPLTEAAISIDCWPNCIPTATGASLEFQMLIRDLTNGQAPIVAVTIYIDGAVARTFGDMAEIQFPPTSGVTFTRETWPGPHDIRIVAVNAQGQVREQTWGVNCGEGPTDQPPDYQTPDDQPPESGPVCPDCGNPIEQCTCP